MYSFFILSTTWAFSPTYQVLLDKYVDSHGCVDYKAWKKDPLYSAFLHDLQHHSPQDDTAYWINIYNAYTIQIVLEHYPVKSIRDIQNGNVWSTHLVNLPHTTTTLDHIEHKILRPRGDARVHAALSCASIGCPPLWNKRYTKKENAKELDQAMKRWLDYNAIRKEAGRTLLSEVFLWYNEDFPSPLQTYLNQWRPDLQLPSSLLFFPYDWKLNENCTETPIP